MSGGGVIPSTDPLHPPESPVAPTATTGPPLTPGPNWSRSMTGYGDLERLLGDIREHIAAMHHAIEKAAQVPSTVLVDVMGSGVVSSAGTVVISCQGPAMGSNWEIRRLAIAGPDPTVALAGTAYVYSAHQASVSMTSQWIDVAVSLPSNAFYSAGQFVVRQGAKLLVAIQGGTAGDTVVVAGAGINIPAKMAQGAVIL